MHTQTLKHKQPPVMVHTLNDEPHGIQAFMYEPESETERESEEAETVEETRLQQDVSECACHLASSACAAVTHRTLSTHRKKIFSHWRDTHARRGDQVFCVKSRQTDVIEPKITCILAFMVTHLTVRSEDETIQRSTFEHRTEGTPNCEESLKPTLEDARSWPMSFERVMKSAAGRSCFRQFLRTEFSEENMMFWLACEDLKKETNKTVVEEKVRQIYEDFISILSPKEVSLDSHVREVINRNMLEPTSHTFEEAQLQIYTLMQRDSYPRYMNSAAYTDLLKSLEEPPSEP
uniref:RGS domain-containing protein n=1 Tax=Sparus aurata TaxID=8175 RepID=A0A671TTA0_SPAAU